MNSNKILDYFYIVLLQLPIFALCTLQKIFSNLVLGSVFSDYVVFMGSSLVCNSLITSVVGSHRTFLFLVSLIWKCISV